MQNPVKKTLTQNQKFPKIQTHQNLDLISIQKISLQLKLPQKAIKTKFMATFHRESWSGDKVKQVHKNPKKAEQ